MHSCSPDHCRCPPYSDSDDWRQRRRQLVRPAGRWCLTSWCRLEKLSTLAIKLKFVFYKLSWNCSYVVIYSLMSQMSTTERIVNIWSYSSSCLFSVHCHVRELTFSFRWWIIEAEKVRAFVSIDCRKVVGMSLSSECLISTNNCKTSSVHTWLLKFLNTTFSARTWEWIEISVDSRESENVMFLMCVCFESKFFYHRQRALKSKIRFACCETFQQASGREIGTADTDDAVFTVMNMDASCSNLHIHSNFSIFLLLALKRSLSQSVFCFQSKATKLGYIWLSLSPCLQCVWMYLSTLFRERTRKLHIPLLLHTRSLLYALTSTSRSLRPSKRSALIGYQHAVCTKAAPEPLLSLLSITSRTRTSCRACGQVEPTARKKKKGLPPMSVRMCVYLWVCVCMRTRKCTCASYGVRLCAN